MAGVGEVLTTTSTGEYEQLVSIIVNGQAGNDTLRGYLGNDVINGLSGNDTLRGLSGNDHLFGNQGNDVLDGGAGKNWLTGGGGADTFTFNDLNNSFAETSTITDYNKSQVDVISLAGGASAIASDEKVGGVWQLTLNGDGDIVRLPGVVDANHDGHIIDDLLIV